MKQLKSSGDNEYETPPEIFNHWNEIFKFRLDVCASKKNAKIPRFYTKKENCFLMPWSSRNWMNPPYGRPENPCVPICKKKRCLPETSDNPNGRGHCVSEYIPGIGDFVRKAFEESLHGRLTVALIPSSRATEWWQRYIHKKADYIYDYPERINFLKNKKVVKGVAFDPCIVIWGLNP